MKKIIFIVMIFIMVQPAFSNTNNHMLDGYSRTKMVFSDSNTGTNTTFLVGMGYNYYLGTSFQLGIDAGIKITNGTDTYELLPGVTYNIFIDKNNSLSKAFFVKLNAGIYIVEYDSPTYIYSDSYVGRDSKFIYTVEIGKRFNLALNVSWAPSIRMTHVPDTYDSDPIFAINLFKISVFF